LQWGYAYYFEVIGGQGYFRQPPDASNLCTPREFIEGLHVDSGAEALLLLLMEWRKGGVGSHYCLQALDESGKFMTGDG
jgi:hypothetical protein